MSRKPDRHWFVPSIERLDDRRLMSAGLAGGTADSAEDRGYPAYEYESAAAVGRLAETSARPHAEKAVPEPLTAHEYTVESHPETSHAAATAHPALSLGVPSPVSAPPMPTEHQAPRPPAQLAVAETATVGAVPIGAGGVVGADKPSTQDGNAVPPAKAGEEPAEETIRVEHTRPEAEQSVTDPQPRGSARTQSAGLLGDFLPADPAALEQAVSQILDRLDALAVPVAEWSPADRMSALWLAAAGVAAGDLLRRRYRDRLPQWWSEFRGRSPDTSRD